jgi:hypothetical protein
MTPVHSGTPYQYEYGCSGLDAGGPLLDVYVEVGRGATRGTMLQSREVFREAFHERGCHHRVFDFGGRSPTLSRADGSMVARMLAAHKGTAPVV